jgi:KDO2-lipid IV(A) lauroyltransferase
MTAIPPPASSLKPHWLVRLAGLLPLAVLRGIGGLLGRVVYAVSPAYRGRMLANLAQAGYGEGPAIRRRAVAEAGRMVGELPWIWSHTPEEVARRTTCESLHVIEEAEAARRGILFLTPHIGGFEATARFCAARWPITVLFRQPKQDWLAALVASSRSCPGMRAVPVGAAGVRALLRALRAGEAVGLLPDQVPGQGVGTWAPFFGRPAYTMTLPERLVTQTGAAVVLAVGERLPGGRGWRLHLERMHEAPTPERLNQRLESLIARLPGQYLWAYNRYKQPAGVPAPSSHG